MLPTKVFNREIAQDLANDFGKPVDIYLHNRMWHTVQQGLQPVPEGAMELETVYPQPGTTPKLAPEYRFPAFR